MAAAVQPTGFARRSFVYRKLVEAGASFGEVAGVAVALDFGDPQGEAAVGRRLGLADLSPLPRIGFKGGGTVEWLAGQGLAVPEQSNRASIREGEGGALAGRLSPTEVLVLGGIEAPGLDLPGRLDAAWRAEPVPPPAPRGYPVPRAESHAWFLVSGEHAAAMFAKLCGVDLRPDFFPPGAIAQTSIARLNGIVIRHDRGSVPGYHLLADSAAAGYLWDCLVDAMAEFAGGLIGLTALRAVPEY